jgi:broad specificity phosphatase PhoE
MLYCVYKEKRMVREATQPMEMLFIRHGQSEANVVQHAEKHGSAEAELAELIYGRHDFEHPLTSLGVQQARAARALLVSEGVMPEEYFDEHYVSPFDRTVETMAFVTDGRVDPLPEVRLIERDWGIYGSTPMQERLTRFAETERRRGISSFYTRYDGGESTPDVIGRFRDWLITVNREKTNQRILAVTHGDLMWTARYVLEGMSPQQWHAMEEDKRLRIGNCCLLWYSRRNPDDPEDISPTITGGWRRMVDPYEPEKSPYDGAWQRLAGRTRLSGAEILAQAEARERIGDQAAAV